jgi:hypothetical protein
MVSIHIKNPRLLACLTVREGSVRSAVLPERNGDATVGHLILAGGPAGSAFPHKRVNHL